MKLIIALQEWDLSKSRPVTLNDQIRCEEAGIVLGEGMTFKAIRTWLRIMAEKAGVTLTDEQIGTVDVSLIGDASRYLTGAANPN